MQTPDKTDFFLQRGRPEILGIPNGGFSAEDLDLSLRNADFKSIRGKKSGPLIVDGYNRTTVSAGNIQIIDGRTQPTSTH